MLRTATLILGLLSCTQADVLPTNFFNNIDGISVDLSARYFCTLEQVVGYDMGGIVRCFGYNDKIDPPKDVFMQVSTSTRGACGITLQQEVKCWGDPIHRHDRFMEGQFTQLSGGENVICGLRINGAISCFYGKWKSFKIQDTGKTNYVQVSCGLNYCCALDDEGLVSCAGDVRIGHAMAIDGVHQNPHMIMEVGEDGTLSAASEDVIPQNTDSEEYEDFLLNPMYQKHPMKFKQIAVAHGYMCGIQYLDESIFCWGNRDANIPLTNMDGPFKMVSANELQVCGILKDTNQLKCAYNNVLTSMENIEWDQVKVGSGGQICGISMNSELFCNHVAADPEVLQELIIA
mmetsp:Transcript_25666/g.43239  ORF Transcript_25666/g.43239 Transcript_25666/m.43239 type:complete len:346 (+) Transcript_25666:66-1103(+)